MLEGRGLDISLITGLVFDTTSVNSGIHKGVAVRLEKHLNDPCCNSPVGIMCQRFGERLPVPLSTERHHLQMRAATRLFAVYGNVLTPVIIPCLLFLGDS